MKRSPSVAVGSVLGAILCILVLGMLAACGGGGSDAPDSPAFGRLTLRITDSPVTSARRVVVEFTGLEIKPRSAAGPEVFDFAPRQIDLLALDGGGSEILLSDELLPAGEYEWIRLKVNAGRDASDSFIELDDGAIHPLFIPSGNQTGLKLIRGFVIGAGSTHNFTIDFDLRKSVIHPPGLGDPYLLKPVLRLVNNLEVGAIEGTVAPALVVDGCMPAVYLFTGADVVPDDIGSATQPLATTAVNLDDATGIYRFKVAFVPAGPYTLGFTCAADDDAAETDDAITFAAPINATVTAGQTTTAEFLAPP
ncbi:MAG TPA: DUF4382 domain-containing protein [Steroidobacteraceae bacterium]|nr:DUF4382 domain-containing protein [Steroidobacteraceae bacterium]